MAIDTRYDLSKRNVEVYLFQVIARTTKLNSFIDAIAGKGRYFWQAYAYIGIGVCAIAMALVTLNFFYIGKMLFSEPTASTGVQLIIPGITLPLVYSLVALVTVVVVHEFSHGIIARLCKIPLKSVGVGILAILPFAFVEPDEEDMAQNSTALSRVKVYAAGSMANMTLAAVVLAIMFVFVVPQLSLAGLTVASVEDGSAGDLGGLEKGLVIDSIEYGGVSYEMTSYEAFIDVMEMTSPSTEIVLNTADESYAFVLDPHPTKDNGYIGITTYDRSAIEALNPAVAFLYSPIVLGIDQAVFPDTFSGPVWFIIDCLKYIFFLNVGIGLFNMLPLGPLDGGKIFRELTDKLFRESLSKVVSHAVSVALLVLIVASLVLPML